MLERLRTLFRNSAKPAPAPASEVDQLQAVPPAPSAPPKKPGATWQEKVQQLGVAPTNTVERVHVPISPASRDFRDLSQEQRDTWFHQQRMRRIDEAERNLGKYAHRYRFMHLSALSPTTRRAHAERHGQLFTAEQLRIFWSDEENRKGCKCSLLVVMLDEEGQPIVGGIVERAREMYRQYQSKLN